MRCPACRHENAPGGNFCAECGTRLALGCPSCGTANAPTNKFCPECGATLGPTVAAPKFASPGSYTPRHLAEKILTSKAVLEGERKQVTILFADVKGSMELLAERDPEDARRILDPVLEHMIEAVHRFEGTVNQVMGDGIMALFGAPVAHEDHAVRACYAALSMQESIRRYGASVRRAEGVPIRIRIGLNSGEVVVRTIASDLHMDYTAVGQTTHLAARMEQIAAPETIVIAPGTLALAEGFVEVKSLGPTPVKGLSDPVEVFELIAASAARSRLEAAAARGLTKFVGRSTEMGQLHEALDLARAGKGQVVAVVGEPGVGKSRLLWEFTRSHRTAGCLVVGGAAVSYGTATAYYAVIELLKHYFALEPGDDTRKIREKIVGKLLSLDRALEPSLPAFSSLLDVPAADEPWASLDPSQRRQRTLDGLKRLLLRESHVQPLIIVFEDLHWIDGETQALLDTLVESLPTAKILLLVNYRPEYAHAWSGKTYYRLLRIDPLPVESAEELLEALLGAGEALSPLKRLLIDRTEGNPFFLEESARSLVEAETLVGERGAYRVVKPLSAIQVPATVQAVLAARIDRLPPEEKNLLQIAAVIGKDVPLALLQDVAAEPEPAVRAGITHLQAAEFIYETSLFPDPEFVFKHALTLEVAYASVLQERRRRLHRRVLEELERRFADRMTERVELLAHHAVRSETWDRAARYLYQAGEKALAGAAYESGAEFYEAAVDAGDRQGAEQDLALKLDACLELWVTRFETGRFRDLRELSEQAEALAVALDDGPRLAKLRVRQAQAQRWVWTGPNALDQAIRWAHEACDLADPGDLRTRSYARVVAGTAYGDLGRFGEAVREFEAGIAVLTTQESQREAPGLVHPIYVTVNAFRAVTYATLGKFQQAIRSAADGLRMASEIAHLPSLALAHTHLGYVHLQKGELAAARPQFEAGLAVAEEIGFGGDIVRTSLCLAHVLRLQGERERGLSQLMRAMRAAESGDYFALSMWSQTLAATAHLAFGRLPEAQAEVTRAGARATTQNMPGHQASLMRLQAEILMAREPNDPAEALRCFQESLTLATELGMRPLAAHDHAGLAKLYRRTGKRIESDVHWRTAEAMYREMGMTYWLESADRELREAR